ncbi:MAG TPA: protein kinase, partial [Kofleriaceae bacterium]|nr:protein kinase [Kofleriaceae bacterium]
MTLATSGPAHVMSSFNGTARFSVEDRIGEGGMGVVYRVVDRATGGRAALKLLASRAPELELRFKREFRALQGLHHANLVTLGELGQTDEGLLFFTMELVDGVDFLTDVRGAPGPSGAAPTTPLSGPGFAVTSSAGAVPAADEPTGAAGFDEARLRGGLRQLAAALAALHGAGIVHRDIKP